MWACKTCTRMHKHSTRVHTHVHAHTLMHAPSTRVHAQNTHARTHTQPHASWPPRWQGRWLLGGEGLFPSHRSVSNGANNDTSRTYSLRAKGSKKLPVQSLNTVPVA